MPNPTIVLLDVMSTLVNEPFLEDVPRFLGMSLDELRARKSPEAHDAFERGHIDEGEYAARFFRDGTRLDIEGMKGTLRASVRLLPGVQTALTRLKDRSVPMYALSNYSPWYRVIDEATGLSRFLDWSFVSCRTGARKPEPEAYRIPLRTLGALPEHCLFIDDRRSNVEAAQAEGIPSILRTPALDLESALKAHGVL